MNSDKRINYVEFDKIFICKCKKCENPNTHYGMCKYHLKNLKNDINQKIDNINSDCVGCYIYYDDIIKKNIKYKKEIACKLDENIEMINYYIYEDIITDYNHYYNDYNNERHIISDVYYNSMIRKERMYEMMDNELLSSIKKIEEIDYEMNRNKNLYEHHPDKMIKEDRIKYLCEKNKIKIKLICDVFINNIHNIIDDYINYKGITRNIYNIKQLKNMCVEYKILTKKLCEIEKNMVMNVCMKKVCEGKIVEKFGEDERMREYLPKKMDDKQKRGDEMSKKIKNVKLAKITDGEYKILKFLTKYYKSHDECLYFSNEQRFDNNFYYNNLSYDFFIIVIDKEQICQAITIEIDGYQHFGHSHYNENNKEEEYCKRITYDLIKDYYCWINNIRILRIHYSEKENMEHIVEEYLDNIINCRERMQLIHKNHPDYKKNLYHLCDSFC